MKKKLILCAVLATSCISFATYYKYQNPLISVIMPIKNQENTLEVSIDSVLNQTYKNFELIIVDDNSTDRSDEIVQKYAQKDKRIKLIKNQKEKGISKSKNIAIDQSKGKYIALMEAGDQLFPNRLEKSLKVFKNEKNVVAISGSTLDPDTPISRHTLLNINTYTTVDNNFALSFIFHNTFSEAAAMFEKKFVDKYKIRYNSNYKNAEAYDFWKQFTFNNGKLLTIYEPLTFHKGKEISAEEYQNMETQSIKIHKEILSRYFTPKTSEIKYAYSPIEKCKLLEKISAANKEKQILKTKEIDRFSVQICPYTLKNAYYIKHPNWEDFIYLKNGEYVMFKTGKTITFKKENDTILLSIKNGPAQRFKKLEDKDEYSFFPEKTLHLSHKNWSDDLIEVDAKNKKYCRFSVQDCGIVMEDKNKNISIKWDNPYYPIERFVFDVQGNKYIQK